MTFTFEMKEVGFKTQLEYGELNVSGDEQHGFRPFQLLVASIAVCSGGVLRKVLDKKRLSYRDITVTADVERNPEGAKEIKKIHLHFRIISDQLTEEQVHKALEITRKNCPMVQSVIGSIEIPETFEIVSE
jgi:putative redox protein